MKYIITLDPKNLDPKNGDLYPMEETNGQEIYNQSTEYETSGKSIVSLGTWAGTSGVINCNFDNNELCILASGKVKLTNQEGEHLILSAGQGFIMQAGFKGTWESLGEVHKWYVIYKA